MTLSKQSGYFVFLVYILRQPFYNFCVSNHGVASLQLNRNLRNLNLSHTSVDDDVVPILEEFPSLETLSIQGCCRLTPSAQLQLASNERFILIGERMMEAEIE